MSSLGGIELPDDMEWVDEFSGWKRGQDRQTSVTGVQIVQEASRQAGRPITLRSGSAGNDRWGVVSRETLDALQALVEAGGTYELVLPTWPEGATRNFTVRFDHGNPIEASPMKHIVPAAPTDYWSVRLTLFTA